MNRDNLSKQYDEQISNFKIKDEIETKINDNKLSDASIINKICDNKLEASMNT
jgi:hypothetical protein